MHFQCLKKKYLEDWDVNSKKSIPWGLILHIFMIVGVKIANRLCVTYWSTSTRIWHVGYWYGVFCGAEFIAHIFKPFFFIEVRAIQEKLRLFFAKNFQIYTNRSNTVSCHLTPIAPGITQISTNVLLACLFNQNVIFYSYVFTQLCKWYFGDDRLKC